MTMTMKDLKNSAESRLGSCKNTVSMYELFEKYQNKKTVGETHKILLNNSITGKNFSEIATILAQNNMKNAFMATIMEKQELLLSVGFTSIKLGKGLAMPKTMFTYFYPAKFESPVLHKLAMNKKVTNRETEIKRPETAKLITYANKEELEELLKNDKTVETTMNNFVVIPPGLVGSIASVGTEKLKLDLLLTLLNFKDMENGGSRTRNKIWPKPLEEIIIYFMGLAKHELFLLNLLPMSVELDKANQGELKGYNKKINTLLKRAELDDEEESEEETESVTEGTSRITSKKRTRDGKQVNHSKDEEHQLPAMLQPGTNNLSLEKQEKIAMIELLTGLSKNAATREAAKSRTKWEIGRKLCKRQSLCYYQKITRKSQQDYLQG